MAISSVTTQSDQEKFLGAKLIHRSYLKLIAASLCEKENQPKGTGKTATFIRYKRMEVPLVPLTEGVDPTDSGFSLEEFSVTLDQWGDFIILTDVSELTTKHPLLAQAMELLSDNAQRVIDREIQQVWLANPNVQYGDAKASRRTLTAADTISDTVINRVRITMVDLGAPPKGGPMGGIKVSAAQGTVMGPSKYVAVCGPQIIGDMLKPSTNMGTFASVAMYKDQRALYNGEVGEWLGLRWVETNFIPKFSLFGNTVIAVASGAAFGAGTPTVTAAAGGALTAVSHFFKVTRKNKLRGFEEDISIEHSITPGAGQKLDFAMPATAGFVYNVYIGTTTGDANMKLAFENVLPGATVSVLAVPGAGRTAPDNVNSVNSLTAHPVYVHGAESCKWVGLQSLKVMLSKPGATTHNPLELRRTVGYKFMAKAMVPDTTRLLRVELTSVY